MLDEQWRKSTSSHTSSCVEVRAVTDGTNTIIEVRDSKDRDGPVLEFTPREWRAFVYAIRNDEFILPAEAVAR